MHKAASTSNLAIIQLLIDAKCNINIRDGVIDMKTCLNLKCIMNGYLRVDILLYTMPQQVLN